MILDFLERIFNTRPEPTSREDVKTRLKLVLAHDRMDFPPSLLESMRQDILAVLERYVELEDECLEFALETSERTTALIANLPIRRVRKPADVVNAEVEKPVEIPAGGLDLSLDEEIDSSEVDQLADQVVSQPPPEAIASEAIATEAAADEDVTPKSEDAPPKAEDATS
jgi:cell division topological specificity factor